MKVVVAYLRERGIRLIIYLDDILIMCHSIIEAQQHRDLVIRLLESLGFIVNLEKSVLNPSQIMEYLGMVVNSINMSLSLPDLKVSYITTLCQVLFKPKVSLREIFSLLGNLSWAIPSIPFAQMHYRDIQNCHIRQLHWANKNFQKEIVLSEDARKDLSWWILNLKSVNGKCFFSDAPELEIYSDASLSGWGAFCDGVRTGGPWTKADKGKHINELEVMAAFFALKSFASLSRKIAIRIFIDNTTAICYINKGGGTLLRVTLLVAWRLSGQASRSRDFRLKWSNYSWQEIVPPRLLHMRQRGAIGRVGTFEEVMIPCIMI